MTFKIPRYIFRSNQNRIVLQKEYCQNLSLEQVLCSPEASCFLTTGTMHFTGYGSKNPSLQLCLISTMVLFQQSFDSLSINSLVRKEDEIGLSYSQGQLSIAVLFIMCTYLKKYSVNNCPLDKIFILLMQIVFFPPSPFSISSFSPSSSLHYYCYHWYYYCYFISEILHQYLFTVSGWSQWVDWRIRIWREWRKSQCPF